MNANPPDAPNPGRITVQIRMDDPEVVRTVGFDSTDCCPDLMREFLKLCGISYEQPFACGTIAIETPRRGPLANRPGMRKSRIEDGYGRNVFTLNDAALSSIRIVCAGDFQNVVCGAVTEVVKGNRTLEEASNEARQLFQFIPPGSAHADIERVLRWAVDNKGSQPYAEARLYQYVKEGDGSFE